jgi:hypothetical protein
MTTNQNAAYLDFPDQQRSLSFESFYENGKQTIELPPPHAGMCICVDLSAAAKLLISWNGSLHSQLDLPAGNHKLPLADSVPFGDGELALELVLSDETRLQRVYILASDYVFHYSEYMFRVYKAQRDAQTLKRLQMQCPAPKDVETHSQLSAAKYAAAGSDAEKLAVLLAHLDPLMLSHMFGFPASLGDTQSLRRQIDAALLNVSVILHKANQIVEDAKLNVEHARYYADQAVANK